MSPSESPTPELVRPRVMLFDWHGTLVNTLDAMYRAIEDILPRMDELDLVRRLVPEGVSRSADDAKLVRYIRIFRRIPPRILAERRVSRTDIFDALFGDDREAIAIAHAEYDRAYRYHYGKVAPFQACVREYLRALRSVGIRIGIATNRKREFLDAELLTIQDGSWRFLFDTVVCGDDVANRKPAPDVLVRALAELDVPRGPDVWFVGDSVADVTTAHHAGVTSVFYNAAFWDQPWFERTFSRIPSESTHPPPDAVVEDFDALFDLALSAKGPEGDGFRDALARERPEKRHPRPRPKPRKLPVWHPAASSLVPPTVVLFDWHATLVDTLDAMYRAVDDTLPELDALGLTARMVAPSESRSADDARLVDYVRSYRQLHPKIKSDRKISRTDIFEVLFGNDEDAKRIAHATFNKHYRNHFGSVLPFEPSVRVVLEALRALGIRLGVITNRDREFFVEELAKVEGTGWAHLFDTAVCGDDTPRRKPHPDQVELAAANLGATPNSSVWYVGDSTTDTIAAKVAGVTSVFFNGAQWDEAWLEKIFPGTPKFPHKPDVVVDDFAEFWALVLACRARSG